MIYILIAFLLGLAVGTGIFVVVKTKDKPIGYLRIDQSDPTEPPYLFLELEADISTICKKNTIFLKVKRKDFLPHK